MPRLVLPLTLLLVLVGAFLWFLPDAQTPPTRLEALREPLSALRAGPGDPALAEGRARALIQERLVTPRPTPDELRAAWRSPDPDVRWAAWLVVENYGTPDASLWEALTRALRPEETADVRAVAAAAALAYGAHVDVTLRPVLERAATDAEPRVRAAAVQILGALASSDPAVWRLLTEGLQDPAGACREASAAALAKIPFSDLAPAPADVEALVEALRQAMHDERDAVPMYAVMTLGRIGAPAKAAVPELLTILLGDAALMQGHAATALGRMGEPALPALARAVREVPAARIPMVLWALRLVGTPAEATLRDVMKTHTNDAVRIVAAMKLWEMQRPIEGLLPAFETALLRGSQEAQLQAARGLERIGSAAATLEPRLRAARNRVDAEAATEDTLRRALDAAIESVTQ